MFKYGFIYKEFVYGWWKKELYSLPQTVNQRSYAMRKLEQIMIGNNVGYRIGGDKKTIDQLEVLTTIYNHFVPKVKDLDLPF